MTARAREEHIYPVFARLPTSDIDSLVDVHEAKRNYVLDRYTTYPGGDNRRVGLARSSSRYNVPIPSSLCEYFESNE